MEKPLHVSPRLRCLKKTPSKWKEKLRENCMLRLRNNRTKLLQSIREGSTSSEGKESIEDILRQEAFAMEEDNIDDTFCFEAINLKRSFLMQNLNDTDEDIDEMLYVMDQIRKELITEETNILSQYEDIVQFDENRLLATISCLQTDKVLCPICQRNFLMQAGCVLHCECGMHVNTQGDGITLEHLKKQLDFVCSSHNQNCRHQCCFSLVDNGQSDLKTMVASCHMCDFMEIVI